MELIKFGSEGNKVTQLQKDLNELGDTLKVDGIFGYATLMAVKVFQANEGIKIDGIVGPNTKKTLEKALERERRPEPKKASLRIVRTTVTDKSTIGKLYLNDEYLSYTLELPWRDNKRMISCIPEGTYSVRKRSETESDKYRYPHLLVENVPNRSGILFHIANYPSDIKGCIGVGKTATTDFVSSSRSAFKNLMRELEPFDDIQLQIAWAADLDRPDLV